MYEPPYDSPYPPPWYGEERRRPDPGYRSPYGYGEPEPRSTLPGSLLLLAGLLGVMNGIVLLMQRDQLARMLDDWGFDASGEIITYTAVVYMILALFPLMGGFLHLMGGKPGIVKLMAVFGIVSFGPMLLSSLLSLIALILLTKSGQPEYGRYPRYPPPRGDRYGYGPPPPQHYGPPDYPQYGDPYGPDPYSQYPWDMPYEEPAEPRPRRQAPVRRSGPPRSSRPTARKRPVKRVVKKKPSGPEGRPKDPPTEPPKEGE